MSTENFRNRSRKRSPCVFNEKQLSKKTKKANTILEVAKKASALFLAQKMVKQQNMAYSKQKNKIRSNFSVKLKPDLQRKQKAAAINNVILIKRVRSVKSKTNGDKIIEETNTPTVSSFTMAWLFFIQNFLKAESPVWIGRALI